MEIAGKTAFYLMALSVLSCGAWAQNSQSSSCTLDPPAFVTGAANIFNDRQEQDLGDAMAERAESGMRLAPVSPADQLTLIGQRLLAALPPSGVHFTFRIYDSGEINAFSTAGGRVYVSRKLITAVKSEDELAGVVAHEIGHISTHQIAIDYTAMLRARLGVTQVTDRADVFARLHQVLSAPPKGKEGGESEVAGELAADRVALYAMVRAGYAVESFPSFFNQVTQNEGKTGSWLSDMFGQTGEETQRYRSALKSVADLPSGCKGKEPAAGAAFLAWQRGILEERVKEVAAGLSGDRPVTLDPPLRPSLWRIRFSPNGHNVLAQDEGSVTVVDKDAGKVLFRIDAPDALQAQFTPDSQSVVFHDKTLRVERWSVATGTRTNVKELVVFDGCVQTLLSQDGRTLMCVNLSEHDQSFRVGLRMIDVESGTPWFDRPNLYQPNGLSEWSAVWSLAMKPANGDEVVNEAMSPDGRYLVTSVSDHILAFDLEKRELIPLNGKLKGLTQTRMSFLGPDQLFLFGGRKNGSMFDARILSFPDGQLIKQTEIGDQQIDSVTKGSFLMTWPLKDYAVGILNPIEPKLLAASKFQAIDVWDSQVATEAAGGGLLIRPVVGSDLQRISLLLGPLPAPRAAAFSSDGKYLALSLKNRAGVWNLDTGKQVALLRPFTSAWIDGNDHLFGQFPKYINWEPKELEFSLSPLGASELAVLDDKEWQYHDMELRFKPLGKSGSGDLHVTFEVKKMKTQTVAWSRDYAHERPACWPAEDDRLVLGWDLNSSTAWEEIRKFPVLAPEINAIKNQTKGILLETVAPETGAPLQQVVIPEADLTGGWNDVRRAMVSGDYVLVRGEHGNTVIYRLSTGAKVGEFFGRPLATGSASGLIAAINREDEILLVDEQSGKEIKRFSLGMPIIVARIIGGKDKALVVLTDDQVVHRLPLPK